MSRSAELRKKNFFKYCQAIFVIGKKVLVNLLDWFYLGGNTNYLDYMLNEYHFYGLDDYLDVTRRYHLKYKTPMDFDMKVIYFLLKLACKLYDGKPQAIKDDPSYILVEEGIDSFMLKCVHLTQIKASITHEELENRLYDLRKLYETLINEGGRLSGRSSFEIKKLHEKSSIGVMLLNSYIKEYNPEFDLNELEPYSERALASLTEQAEKVVATQGVVTMNDLAGFFKDIMDKKMFCRVTRRPKPRDKLGDDDVDEDEEKIRVFLEELQEYKTSLDEKEALKAEKKMKGSGKSLMGKKQSGKKSDALKKSKQISSARSDTSSSFDSESLPEDDKKSTLKKSLDGKSSKSTQLNEISKDGLRSFALQYRVQVMVNPVKTTKMPSPQGVKPSSICRDTDFVLKEHKKYSRRPGRQVKLSSLFVVEGLNAEVANIIILSGEGGTGKTFLSKYIIDKWNDEPTAFDGLDTRVLIFFAELKDDSFRYFSELVSQKIKSLHNIDMINSELLLTEVLSMPILVVLDGYDDSCEKSCQLVKEVLQLEENDVKVVVTCRLHHVETIYQQIPKSNRRHVSHVTLNGLPQMNHADCIRRIVDFQLPNEKKVNGAQVEKNKEGLISYLPNIYSVLGDDLCNPHMLSIIAGMWLETPHSD